MRRPGRTTDDDVLVDHVDDGRVNPYEVLGVPPTASDAEVRRAYVALARRFHPDANPGGEDRMRAINEAWAILGDRARRVELDRSLRREAPDPGFRPDDPTDDVVDPRAQPDVPYRPRTSVQRERRNLVTVAPVALFAAAIAAASAGFFLDNPPLIGVGVVLFSASCLGLVVVLLVELVDARRDEG